MRSLTEKFKKLYRLTPVERAVLLEAWGSLFIIGLRLRFQSPRRLLGRVPKKIRGRARMPAGEEESFIARSVWLVEVAGRYTPVKATCLRQALVLHRILGRGGIETDLRIGVARQDEDLEAHAWLERDGKPIFGVSDDNHYDPLPLE